VLVKSIFSSIQSRLLLSVERVMRMEVFYSVFGFIIADFMKGVKRYYEKSAVVTVESS
jgi:hypothetical protein